MADDNNSITTATLKSAVARAAEGETYELEAAIAADPYLLDAEAVGEAIFRARYADERWKQRLARTQKHGVGPLDYPFAGKKKKKVLMHPHVS